MNESIFFSGTLILPLVGAVLAFGVPALNLGSARLGALLAAALGGLSFCCALTLYLSLSIMHAYSMVPLIQLSLVDSWLAVGELDLAMTLVVDRLSLCMMLVITGIGSLIQFYSIGYMAGDPGERRYHAYVALFMFFMTLLVTAGNLPLLFVGWEGVGLCSYLLIGYWFERKEYCVAAQKAFVVNRIGDAGFLVGMIALFAAFGTWNIAELATKLNTLGSAPSTEVLIFVALALSGLLFAVTAKSAQIPLFVWLPDAMVGPTPASALIHAATMVTAGIYLLARLHFLCDYLPDLMELLLIVGAVTSIMAALIACAQRDIKKVLAYSTVSQLGFMVVAAAGGHYGVAIFHVVTHAFFKATLFLGAGSVIHACDDNQDLGGYGGLFKKMPYTAACFCVASLALAGVAPFSGFYSKYLITHSLASDLFFVEVLLLITSFLTAFYIARVVLLTFFGSYRGTAHPHESNWLMRWPVLILSFGSLLAGVYLFDLPGYLVPGHDLGDHGAQELLGIFIEGDFSGFLLKNIIAVAGISVAVLIYCFGGCRALLGGCLPLLGLRRLAEREFFWNEIYDTLCVRPFKATAAAVRSLIDPYFVDGLVDSTWMSALAAGEVGRLLQSGQVRHYALQMFGLFLFLLLFYMIL